MLSDVINDTVASLHTEINIEIGHRHAFGIEKSLEQQIVIQRVKIGDAEYPGNQRARTRTTSRANRYFVRTRPAYEIGDYQEVTRKTHADDDIKLGRQTREVGGADRISFIGRGRLILEYSFKLHSQAASRFCLQILFLGLPVGHGKRGQHALAEFQIKVAPSRDLVRILDRLRNISE